ncbi:hypothetical protein DDI_1102 [Dickeya dianthicola RNS04.9]|nr:hypothetical protein DDI_1102 [Dickeya dianthicola RNS04.9]
MAKVDRTVSIRQRARYQNFVCDLSHSGELACWLVNEEGILMLPHRALMRKPWGEAGCNKTRAGGVDNRKAKVEWC